MPRRRKIVTIDINGEECEFPYEFLQIVRLVSRRTGQTEDEVMTEWLDRVMDVPLKDPEGVHAALAADVRYCKLEGVDKDEYFFRRCQAFCRRLLKALRAGAPWPAHSDNCPL